MINYLFEYKPQMNADKRRYPPQRAPKNIVSTLRGLCALCGEFYKGIGKVNQ